jgi:hypothetical protein
MQPIKHPVVWAGPLGHNLTNWLCNKPAFLTSAAPDSCAELEALDTPGYFGRESTMLNFSKLSPSSDGFPSILDVLELILAES